MRETWNESERLGEKKERVKRERKKGKMERETYERIQGMRKKKKKKKRLRRIIISKLNF
jgi:hypothetical protein